MQKHITNNCLHNKSETIENKHNSNLKLKSAKDKNEISPNIRNIITTGVIQTTTQNQTVEGRYSKQKATNTLSSTKFIFKTPKKRITNKVYLEEELEILHHLNREHMMFRPKPQNLEEYANQCESRKTLILNLETFIHIETAEIEENFEYKYNLEFTSKNNVPFYVRAHTYEFLLEMKNYYEIVFFTSLEKDLAKDILEVIWEEYKETNIIGREGCSLLGDFTIKELKTINNRAEENIVILDHLLATWCFDQDNLLYIPPFNICAQNKGITVDIGLLDVIDLLKELMHYTKYNSPLFIGYCQYLAQ